MQKQTQNSTNSLRRKSLNYYEILFSELSGVTEYLVVGSGAHQMIRHIGNLTLNEIATLQPPWKSGVTYG